MTAIKLQEVKPFFTDPEDDQLVPYFLVEEHNEGRHTITVGGGFTLDNMRPVVEAMTRALRAVEFKAEVQEGSQ